MLITDQLTDNKFFSDTESSIANYFLEKDKSLSDLSARKIANELYISASTIVRFCQKLGFSGFDDFKTHYIEEIDYLSSHFNSIDSNRPFKTTDNDWQIANSIGQLYKETIDDTLNLIHFKTLEQIRHQLVHSRNIYIHSVGDVLVPAYNFMNKMIRLGRTVNVIERSDLAYIKASHIEKSDCFILISYSGETDQILRIAKKLKEREIPLIIMTSFGENTLSNYADIILNLSTREKLINNLGNFSSVLSVMYLFDVLYASIFGDDYETNYQRKTETALDYEKYRHSNNPLLND